MIKINMQYFGGRGGSSGGGGGGGAASSSPYISEDNTLMRGEPLEAIMETYSGSFADDRYVLEAKTDGKGNLTLSKPSAKEYEEWNSNTTYGHYEIKNGITNSTGYRGRDHEPKVVNIDFANVKSVQGQTYPARRLMRELGFRWDGSTKTWRK
jgi:hypothetical protein